MIDYESLSSPYKFTQLFIKVIDKGGNSATQTMTVTVTPANDEYPVCPPSYFADFDENVLGKLLDATIIL